MSASTNPPGTPAVRVFLLTCRRPNLLPRALASLRAQTFTNWVCELHNDAPEDNFPRRLVTDVADSRVTLHHHEHNWGAVATFNHAFAGGPEPFLALLEDDNWWEPDFLTVAHAAMLAHPDANAAWANLRLWRENADRTWTNTGNTVWAVPSGEERPRLFRWPVPRQCFDALHSNGAMLCRADASRAALVPPDTPFDIIEPVRERLLSGAWLLLPRPLANFALTLETARATDRVRWVHSQLLVAASYLLAVRPPPSELARLWTTLREQRPPATNLLFLLALSTTGLAPLLRFSRPVDWARFLTGAARRPLALIRSLRYQSAHAALWSVLAAAAHARCAENPFRADSPSLFIKQLEAFAR